MVFYIHYFGIIVLFHHTLTSLFNIIYYRFLDLLKTRNILSLRAEQELKMKKNFKVNRKVIIMDFKLLYRSLQIYYL